jgi:hypothetical protein
VYLLADTTFDSTNFGLALIMPNVNYNVGSYYNAANGLFTAPYTGTYIFFGSSYANVNQSQSWLVVNGSRAAGSDWTNSTSSAFTSAHWTFRLTANDTCGFHPYNGNASSLIYNNPFHTYFKGYFLG